MLLRTKVLGLSFSRIDIVNNEWLIIMVITFNYNITKYGLYSYQIYIYPIAKYGILIWMNFLRFRRFKGLVYYTDYYIIIKIKDKLNKFI